MYIHNNVMYMYVECMCRSYIHILQYCVRTNETVNELPQVGLEPMTLCTLDRCSELLSYIAGSLVMSYSGTSYNGHFCRGHFLYIVAIRPNGDDFSIMDKMPLFRGSTV